MEFNIIVEYCFTRVINDINNYLTEGVNTKEYELLEGFSSFHNYRDTHAFLDIEKAGIDKNEQKTIEIVEQLFEEKTGFNLSIQ